MDVKGLHSIVRNFEPPGLHITHLYGINRHIACRSGTEEGSRYLFQ